ncbi:MAG: asparagine synthetase B, partial [Bacteroidia bacterium]|nr:asparagine synthetase B [Bacteroidia bacterium]
MLRAFFLFILTLSLQASRILIYMDEEQKNHLKAYGIAYYALKQNLEIHWLLNYRGGSFLIPHTVQIQRECNVRGVSYEVIGESAAQQILMDIARPEVNQDAMKLEKAPKIAVYSPPGKQPWDDAVTLVLTYAEIPYDVVYDEELYNDKLKDYDWLHLHHEDFTGQYGKFYAGYRNMAWYQAEVRYNEALAKKLGFSKVSLMKLNSAKKIKEYVFNGGFM